MPLACLRVGKLIYSFWMSQEEWVEIRRHYRQMQLTMPCCGSLAIPKESKCGTRFFAHKVVGEAACSIRESVEHLTAKYMVAQGAHEAGWEVATEVCGTTPAEEAWRADVLCEKEEKKVAFEIQLSAQTYSEYVRRQERYKASGVACFWLKQKRVTEYFSTHKALPIFNLDVSNLQSLQVSLGNAEKWLNLREFIRGVLIQDLKWRPSVHSITEKVFFEIVKQDCWRCQNAIKVISAYSLKKGWPFTLLGDVCHLDKISEVEGPLLAAVHQLRKEDVSITPISVVSRKKKLIYCYIPTEHRQYYRDYFFCAACPNCKAPHAALINSQKAYCQQLVTVPGETNNQNSQKFGHWIWKGEVLH